MKRLSFLAIIAVLAMSFTIASHEGAVKSKVSPVNCYTTFKFAPTTPCTFVDVAGEACNISRLVDKPIITLQTGTSLTCEENDNFFCCATLLPVESPICTGHTVLPVAWTDENGVSYAANTKRAKISHIYCKPTL